MDKQEKEEIISKFQSKVNQSISDGRLTLPIANPMIQNGIENGLKLSVKLLRETLYPIEKTANKE